MAVIDIGEAVPNDVTLDTVSLMPYLADAGRESIRDTIYADAFTTDLGVKSGEYAIRGERYKFLVDQGVEHFFDLEVDPYEHMNLLEGELSAEQRAGYDGLKAHVDTLHASEL